MSSDGHGEPQRPAAPSPGPSHGPFPVAAPIVPASQRPLFVALGAITVAGLVVLVMAVAGVFSPASTASGDGSSPRSAVEDALYASKRQNLDDLKAAVCRRDLTNPELSQVVGDDHAQSYSIGQVRQQGDRARVEVRVTTAKRTSSASLPVVRENGAWKVCFSEIENPTSSSASASPTDLASDSTSPSGSLSSPTVNFCASATDAVTTAKYFASFVGLDLTSQAASCVYENRLSSSAIEALTGDIYSPDQVTSSGSTFSFPAATRTSTLDVVVEKQSDGRYYVVAARKR